MKIRQIDGWTVAIKLPQPFRPAWIPGYRQIENRFALVRVTTDSGLRGWSATPCMGTELRGIGSLLGPYLIGERADDLASVRARLREMSYLGLHLGWIEPACWDIIGKAFEQPVYKLLGGKSGRVAAYASTGTPLTTDLVPQIERRFAEGYPCVKVRTHGMTLEEDVSAIQALRRALGDGPRVAVDANQGWRVSAVGEAPRWDRERALAFTRAAQDADIAWIEEPLAMNAYDDLAALRRASNVPIAGGEMNRGGPSEFGILAEKGCYDIYQPDVIFVGGIGETWRIIDLVTKSGARYLPHTWTNGLGLAINLHVFAGTNPPPDDLAEYPIDENGWTIEARDGGLAEPIQAKGGWIDLSERPGFGFEIDRGALRRYGSRLFKATSTRVALSMMRRGRWSSLKSNQAVREERLTSAARDASRWASDPAEVASRGLRDHPLENGADA